MSEQEQHTHLHPRMVIKSQKVKPLDKSLNIFETNEQFGEQEPSREFRRYSVVGDKSFVDKIAREMSPAPPQLPLITPVQHSDGSSSLGQTAENIQQRLMNTTQQISRFHSQLLSRLSRHQQLSMTREQRHMNYFKQQQSEWSRSSKPRSHSVQQPTFSGDSARIFVENNPNLDVLINNNPGGYWRKSLRNNDPGIMKYVRGVPFDRTQLEQLLQTAEGTKLVVSKVPKIDAEAVKNLEKSGGLVLTARSKYKSQLQNTSDFSSLYRTERYPDHLDEIYKVDWNRRDLARKNLPLLPKMQLHQ